MDLNANLLLKLKQLRITQRAIARASGISDNTINKRFGGSPISDMNEKLLEVTINKLLKKKQKAS